MSSQDEGGNNDGGSHQHVFLVIHLLPFSSWFGCRRVTESAPREEMYKNDVVETNTVEEKVNSDSSGSGWEGSLSC